VPSIRSIAPVLVAALVATRDAPSQTGGFRLEKPLAAAGLAARFTAAEIDVLEMINRADRAHLDDLDVLLVPASWPTDVLDLSPLPRVWAWAAAHAKTILVHQPTQALAAYESGRLVRWGPVSTGRRPLPTPAGLFHLNWRSPGRTSTVDPGWFLPWYFNFENDRGISFHQFALPGLPASHACVRLLERDAKWLYEWGETWTLDARGWTVLDPGTPVVVAGCYDFNAPPPWRAPPAWGRVDELPSAPEQPGVICAPG
jgi:hypothetical protein